MLSYTIYISASLRDKDRARALAQAIESMGCQIALAWWDVNDDEIDDKNQFAQDMIDWASQSDFFVWIPPGGRGSHIEMGAAFVNGIETFSLGRVQDDRWTYFYSKIDHWCDTQEELLKCLDRRIEDGKSWLSQMRKKYL